MRVYVPRSYGSTGVARRVRAFRHLWRHLNWLACHGPNDQTRCFTVDFMEQGEPGRKAVRRWRPPEASLSADVYERLHQVATDERRDLHSQARPFGVIVMDALERHADRLNSAWKLDPTPAAGSLFVRPTASAVPRRRRHVRPPRSIPLSGIDETNSEVLDKLAQDWGAPTRSALVEQALRYEFELDGQDSGA